jgi:manganese transport protein
VFPLVQFTSEKAKMGRFVNPAWLKWLGRFIAVGIAVLNGYLLYVTIFT